MVKLFSAIIPSINLCGTSLKKVPICGSHPSLEIFPDRISTNVLAVILIFQQSLHEITQHSVCLRLELSIFHLAQRRKCRPHWNCQRRERGCGHQAVRLIAFCKFPDGGLSQLQRCRFFRLLCGKKCDNHQRDNATSRIV